MQQGPFVYPAAAAALAAAALAAAALAAAVAALAAEGALGGHFGAPHPVLKAAVETQTVYPEPLALSLCDVHSKP